MTAMLNGAFADTLVRLLTVNLSSRLLFIAQILLAVALFAMFFPRRKLFWVRAPLCIVIFIPVSLILDALLISVSPMLSYLAIFLLTIAIVPICFKTNVWNTLFCCVSASVTQNISYSLGVIASAVLNINPDITYGLVTGYVQVPVYLLCHFIVFMLCATKLKGVKGDGVERIPIIIIVLLSTFVIFFAQFGRQSYTLHDFYWWKVLFISCDVLCLFLMYGMFERSKLKAENALLEQLMQKESKQYELNKNTIELINIKCHDIKHQINALRTMSSGEQQENIKEIEDSVMIYDSLAKTGNAALDVILTSKSLLCEQHKIRLAYMCDGEKLEVLGAVDIYSLFGNALDNAIEAVKTLEDETKRIVNLYVAQRGSFLSIHMENYCETELTFKSGLPVTTKDNEDYHGFGLLSIRYIAEKYNGVMSTSLRNSMFSLDVVIPVE